MVSRLSDEILRTLIPILLISVAIFFILNRQVKTDLSNYIVLLTPLIFLIGFYDGFFGPGTGSFFVMLFLIFKNQTLLESTATSKLLNFASNFAAFIIFALQGYVIWELGIIMAVGGITGAYLGSKSAIKVGDKLIRPILVVVSILLSSFNNQLLGFENKSPIKLADLINELLNSILSGSFFRSLNIEWRTDIAFGVFISSDKELRIASSTSISKKGS